MRTVTRITHGLYQTSDGWRIEKVNNLAREAGYSAGWHVYSPIGEYCNTYQTKGEALQAIPEQAEPPPESLVWVCPGCGRSAVRDVAIDTAGCS